MPWATTSRRVQIPVIAFSGDGSLRGEFGFRMRGTLGGVEKHIPIPLGQRGRDDLTTNHCIVISLISSAGPLQLRPIFARGAKWLYTKFDEWSAEDEPRIP